MTPLKKQEFETRLALLSIHKKNFSPGRMGENIRQLISDLIGEDEEVCSKTNTCIECREVGVECSTMGRNELRSELRKIAGVEK